MLASGVSSDEVLRRRVLLDNKSSKLPTVVSVAPVDLSSSSSSTSSYAGSPIDSPRRSPSSTSLSSVDSNDACLLDNEDKAQEKRRMFDGYGNEFEVPDYTMKQIHDAIPKHCFERSAARGLAYVARDVASLAGTFYVFHNYVTPDTVPWTPLRYGLWALYTFIQGCFGTGLWIMAHECGHMAFSPSKTLNDIVGWFCHSSLGVPYFSWKLSHSKHHKANGNIERDMAHVPYTRDEFAASIKHDSWELSEMIEDAPIVTALNLVFQQLVGWQAYLLANASGHNNHERQSEGKGVGKSNGLFGGVSHFLPSSPLYEKKDEHLILLSDLGLLITGTILVLVGRSYGWMNVLVWYGVPYLWVNHWIVALTWLQHTDPSIPHYEGKSWNFTRGAAATIDREFGFIGRQLFHGIIETHVLHHHISTIPFYNAYEATEAIKPIMGQHYRSDTKDGSVGFIKAMWKVARWCEWVEPSNETDSEGVLFFRNRNGLGAKPMQIAKPQEIVPTSE